MNFSWIFITQEFKLCHLRTQIVMETINVVIDDNLKEPVMNNLDDMFV